MSLFSDYEAEYEFERDFPFGVPSDTWKTKDGRKIKVSNMTEQHIKNCMRLVGENDGWYGVFYKELKRGGGVVVSDIKMGAHWIYPEDSDKISCICSFCKFEGKLYEDDVSDMPYCPRCGNRMLNIPIKHAHWIMHDDEILGLTSECSNCHIEGMYDGVYCNVCNSKMDEEKVWIKEPMGKAIS